MLLEDTGGHSGTKPFLEASRAGFVAIQRQSQEI
jgi:hypothetical protein